MNSKQGTFGATQVLFGSGPLSRLVFAAALGLLVLGLAVVNRMTDLGPNWGDPDAMMRLVEVRDLLAGQGWFDLIQYRLDPPGGVLMHWSRFVDAPIAALIIAATPFLGRASAELFAVNVWPLLLAFPFSVALASAAGRLGGEIARYVTLLMIFLSPPVKALFVPGDIDHHNVQAVLIASALMGLVRVDGSRRWPILAGIFAALSLTIGMETLLVVLLAILGLALAWTVNADRWRLGLQWFVGSLMVSTLLAFVATVPSSRWLVPACDALSFAYVIPVWVGGGAVFALAAMLRGHSDGVPGILMRGGALIAVAFLLVTIAAVLFPACLAGPYGGIDPAIRPIWLDTVDEARGFMSVLRLQPFRIPPLYLAPLAAFVLGLLALRQMPAADRPAFAIILSMLGGSLLLGTVQVRALMGAQIVASAAVGVVVGTAVKVTSGRNDAWAVIHRWSWLTAAPILWVLVVQPVASLLGRPDDASAEEDVMLDCRSFFGKVLAAQPPGLIVATSNFGSFLLEATQHSVLAAPYHRGAHGILAVDAIFTGSDPEATLRASGASYLAVCTGDVELHNMADRAPSGLAAQLIRGGRPTWLAELASGSAGTIFSVKPIAEDITASLPALRLRPSIRD